MTISKLSLEGAFIIKPNSYCDERGEFSRLFCKNDFSQFFENDILQINHSLNYKKGTFRGFHFQKPPYSEEKIIKCVNGSVADIIIDLRKNSKTFLKTHTEVLSKKNRKTIFIPKGFAHGFQTLEDNTELIYFHSEFYNPNKEYSLNYKDPLLKIDLPLEISKISSKDENIEFLNKNFKGFEI